MRSNTPTAIQQEEKREADQEPSTSYPSSPARLHSTVLQTMAPQAHPDTKARKMTPDRPTGQIEQSSITINTLKEETGRFQEIFPDQTKLLEEQCDAVHEQQAALLWTIDTELVPYMLTISELLVDVCEQLATRKFIILLDQQQTETHTLCAHSWMVNPTWKPNEMACRSCSTNQQPTSASRRLHRYNQNLILIGDLNARHSNWHDDKEWFKPASNWLQWFFKEFSRVHLRN